MMSYLSEDGFSDSCEDVEIQIETLMGNSFDMRVSSTDTIQDIKQRIQRVEGVPVTHQNLIYKSEELKNTKRLSDVGITDGSKLQLVLSMRGGPISTRRLSTPCEHHLMLNELEELLDITRDEKIQKLTSGSKMSVLVFKEGDMINLIRVVENEDGSYSPYNDKPASPLSDDERFDSRSAVFEKVIENNRMMSNLSTLRKKMEDVHTRKQTKPTSIFEPENDNNKSKKDDGAVSFPRPRIFFDDEDLLETDEIALKDKHRTKRSASPKVQNGAARSVFSATKGTFSQTKHAYANINRKTRQVRKPNPRPFRGATDAENAADDELRTRLQGPSRLASESPKAGQLVWGVQRAPQLLGRLPSCKVGLVKRDNYGAAAEETLDVAPNGLHCPADDCNVEMCSSSSRRGSPVLHYANYCNEDANLCDYYVRSPKCYPKFGDNDRTRESSWKNRGSYRVRSPCDSKGEGDGNDIISLIDDITERLTARVESSTRLYEKTDWKSSGDPLAEYKENTENLVNKFNETMDEIYCDLRNVTNLLCDTKISDRASSGVRKKCADLPPVIKKKARCLMCNKRLNITNIYNCRCGNIYCSQHRYPEVHHCTYDYKLNGRKLLEKQNPLVTADKIDKI